MTTTVSVSQKRQLPLKNSCFVSSITLLALRKLGVQSLDYEPQILRDAVQAQFGVEKLPQKLFDKLNCGYMLIGTDAFVSTIQGFLTATAVMNNKVFQQDEIPYCTLQECAWSIWEYMNLLGQIDNGKPTQTFCQDICQYLRQVGRTNGVSKFPQWLQFAEAPDTGLPDMTGDVSVFQMYQARQQDYISDMNGFVTEKQAELTQELTDLQKAGYIG